MGNFLLWTMWFIIGGFGYVNGVVHLDSECVRAQNSTIDTIYKANLRTVLDFVAKNAPLQGGFSNASVGNGTNRVHGLGWCRADVSPTACFDCLNKSISIPLRECPESKWFATSSSLCSLRFSNESFFGEVWSHSSSSSYGSKGLDDPLVFSRGFVMMEMLGNSVPNQPMMFQTSVTDVEKNRERYGLGQCSPDVSRSDCRKCLEELLVTYKPYVMNQTKWEMLGVSCGMWYDDVRFYGNSSSLTPAPNASGGEGLNQRHVIFTFVAFLVLQWIA
ncbi:putative cysteine-rich receptor-like protein kinase 9 [Cynara cardunculus var. scolymus]|uniref:putative cysteine-rich receptor-like protein kinase 9 n=1 Tax=Cynara cardunculus var. scolymus TaxID=59895 RepID=UPI000D62CBD4|nr:putative cysteine-rich receptor-like protein kinase 9 [Cynara cardunculus var. scolymus]